METALIVSSILLWLVVVFNLLLTLGLVRRLNAHRVPASVMGLKAGEAAPDFTAQTLSGERVTLAIYAKRNVAFIFFSIHCGPCHEILPYLERLRPKAAGAGVELILVSADGLNETRAYVEKQNISLPVLVAPRSSSSFMEDYKSTSTPSYCFINHQGKIRSAGLPILEEGEWKALDDFLTASAMPVASERR